MMCNNGRQTLEWLKVTVLAIFHGKTSHFIAFFLLRCAARVSFFLVTKHLWWRIYSPPFPYTRTPKYNSKSQAIIHFLGVETCTFVCRILRASYFFFHLFVCVSKIIGIWLTCGQISKRLYISEYESL